MDLALIDDPGYLGEDRKAVSSPRSPNYPAVSFVDALDRTKVLFKAMRLGKAEESFIAHALGYSGLSGRSRSIISAIRKYGLISPEGKQVRLSDDARALVMLTPDDVKYREAATKCSLLPQIFQDLFHQYGFDLPEDKHIEFWLIERRFQPDAASDLVKIYKENLAFVKEIESTNQDEASDEGTLVESHLSPIKSKGDANPDGILESLASQKVKELNFPLAGGCSVKILFTGDLIRENVEKTIRYLEIFAEDFPSGAKLNKEEG